MNQRNIRFIREDYLGREIGLTGKQAYDASQNVKTHGFGAFGNWFL